MSNSVPFIKLEKIAEFRNGLNFSSSSKGNGCLLVGVSDFKSLFSPNWSALQQINPLDITKEEDFLKKGDIVFVRSNGNKNLVGRSLFIDQDISALYSGFCIRARIVSDLVDPKFLAYFTKTKFFKSSISYADGTSINNLNQKILGSVRVPLFPKEVQLSIVRVLSSIDEKIKINNKIQSNLEKTAQLLYDYWFTQFDFPNVGNKPYKLNNGTMIFNPIIKKEIPLGWKVDVMEKLGTIVGGSTPNTNNSENFTDKGISWITPNDLSNNKGNIYISKGAVDVTIQGCKSASLKKYPKGTVLLSSRAPIGYVAIADCELTTNQGFKSFIPNKGYSSRFIFLFLKNQLKSILQNSSGSTFKEISGGVLKSLNVVLPPTPLVKYFDGKVEPMFEQIHILEKQNRELIDLKNWLLPMLMNGQISIRDAEKHIGKTFEQNE